MVSDWVEEKEAAATKESRITPVELTVPPAASSEAAATIEMRAR